MLTLAQVQAAINGRCSMFMTRLDWTTDDLTPHVAWAVRALGHDTADFVLTTDAEIAEMPDSYMEALVDVSEMRSLEVMEQNFEEVSIRVGSIDQKIVELGQRLHTVVERKRSDVIAQHGGKLVIRLSKDAERPASIKAL